MGLCLSGCGEAHHKAAVVAATISHHSSSSAPAGNDLHDHNRSLNKFLNLYDSNGIKRKSSASPRPSLEDSLVIPHSSELFSLPSENSSSDRSRSPSPARASRASTIRSSISSRGTSSPQSRNSVGSRGGRFSTEKPPTPPKASTRKVSSYGSFSSAGPDDVPRRSLLKTIAHLEKFCNVKLFLENRCTLHRNSLVRLNSTAHESSIVLHDSCRDFAQKFMGLANQQDIPYSNLRSPQLVSRAADPTELKGSNGQAVGDNVNTLVEPFKISTFVKSVSCPLQEAEIISIVETSQNVNDQMDENKIQDATRLPTLMFQDVDNEFFTDFEASFELCSAVTKTASDLRLKALPSAETSITPQSVSSPKERALGAAECGTDNAASQPAFDTVRSSSMTTSELDEMNHFASHMKEGKKEKGASSRPALTDISSNVTPAHDSLARKKYPLKLRTFSGLRKGVSRSLDLQDCSISQGSSMLSEKKDGN